MKKVIAIIFLFVMPTNAALSVKVGTFVKPASTTGDQEVTEVGFQPKIVFFFGNSRTSSGSHAGARIFFGMMDGSGHQASMGMQDTDAAARSATDKRWSNTHCISHIIDGTPTVSGEAAYTSMNSGGFTINWHTCDATQWIVNYIALGGDDLTNAFVGSFTCPTATDSAFEVPGAGFTPDALIFMEDNLTTTPLADITNAASAVHALSFVKSTSARAFSRFGAQDNVVTMNTFSYQRSDRVHTTLSGTPAEVRIHDLVSYDADGFTLNFSLAATSAVYQSYAAFKGAQVKVGSFNQNTTTGNQSIDDVGFQPKIVLFQSINQPTSTSIQNYGRYSFGAATSSTERASVWIGSTDNVADDISDSVLDTENCLVMYTEGTPTVTTIMDFVSMDPGGFTVTNDTVDGTSREVIYFAMGDALAAPTGGGTLKRNVIIN